MKKEPIRVLQIMGIVESGGVEAVIMNYYKHIDKSRVQFDFVVHKGSNPNYIAIVKAMGAKVYEVTPYSNPIGFMKDVYKIIKQGDYRIVHSNMNALSVFPLLVAYLAGVPVRILHNHTTDTKAEPLRTFIKRLLRPFAKLFANQYWACSKLAGEWMYGKGAVESGKVEVINNAIDLQKFAFNQEKRDSLRQELDLTNSFVVGHVGRFMTQKNHEFLVDIFAEIAREKANAKLLLIGEGVLKSKIERKVKLLGIANRVIFTGARSDVADLYNAMDVFLLPSHYEGLALVGVEAQANGLQYFLSDVITREVEVTDLCHFISLNKSAKEWSDDILSVEGAVRENKLTDISKAGFDITVETKKVEKFYLEVY